MVVREQKRTRAISVGESPSKASSAMCILSLRLGFALHLDDEALAYLGGDGDILHVRPSLRWLDGCGVFTMPQRTAVCSIILCIFLAGIPKRCLVICTPLDARGSILILCFNHEEFCDELYVHRETCAFAVFPVSGGLFEGGVALGPPRTAPFGPPGRSSARFRWFRWRPKL